MGTSRDILIDAVDHQKMLKQKHIKEKAMYKKAYKLLLFGWHEFSDKTQRYMDKELEMLGL